MTESGRNRALAQAALEHTTNIVRIKEIGACKANYSENVQSWCMSSCATRHYLPNPFFF